MNTRHTISLLFFLFLTFALSAQTPVDSFKVESYESLPTDVFQSAQAEANGVELTFFPPSTKSVSFDGKNAKLFMDLILAAPPTRLDGDAKGFIMLLVSGDMILSGNLYLWDDMEGAFEFTYDKKKYYQKLSKEGVKLLKDSM
jgi:hypothetical protein